MDIVEKIVNYLGLGTGVGLAVYLSMLAARSALAEAVRLAGEREIGKHRHELALELEHRKQELAKVSQREIEHLRSELTLKSETRRLIATLKVKHLLEYVRAADEVMRFGFNRSRTAHASGQINEMVERMNACVACIRDIRPAVSGDLYGRLVGLPHRLLELSEKWILESDTDAVPAAHAAIDEVIDLIRQELGVVALDRT